MKKALLGLVVFASGFFVVQAHASYYLPTTQDYDAIDKKVEEIQALMVENGMKYEYDTVKSLKTAAAKLPLLTKEQFYAHRTWWCLWSYKRGSDCARQYELKDNKIYVFGEPTNLDVKTFSLIDEEYGKDKKYVYNLYRGIIKGADPKTFQITNIPDVTKDKRYIYWMGQKLKGGDGRTFVDLKGFHLFKDKYRVYFDGRIIKGLDARTVKLIASDNGGNLLKDKKSVYYNDKKLSQIDVKTVQYLGGDFFVKDKKNVYRLQRGDITVLRGVDVASFQYVSESYMKDKNGIYCSSSFLAPKWNAENSVGNTDLFGLSKMPGVDVSSFSLLSKNLPYMAKDKNRMYFGCDIIQDADGNTFVPLTGGYAKDAKSVYYNTSKIDADPITFKATIDSFASDKSNIYYRGNSLEGIMPSSFSVIGNNYFQNQGKMYYLSFEESNYLEMEGVDINSFVTDGYDGFAEDKSRLYKKGEVVTSHEEIDFIYY